MSETERQKISNAVSELEGLVTKIDNLTEDIGSLKTTIGDDISIDDHPFDEDKLNSIESDLASISHTIKNTVIPKILEKIEE